MTEERKESCNIFPSKQNIFVLPRWITLNQTYFYLAWRLTGVQMNETFVKKRMVHLKYCIEHSKTQSFRSQPQGLSQWMSKIIALCSYKDGCCERPST